MVRSKAQIKYIGRLGQESVLRWQGMHYADAIIKAMKHTVLVQLIAQMQIGKTETIEALSYKIWSKYHGKVKVYVISAVALKDLRDQDRARLTNAHLTYLDKFEIKRRVASGSIGIEPNSIVVIDESHWGSHKDQMLAQAVLRQIKRQRTVNLVLVSATPYNTLCSVGFLDNARQVLVKANDYSRYIGIEHFFRRKLIADIFGMNVFFNKKKKAFEPWVDSVFLKAVREFLGQKKRKVFLVRTRTAAEAKLLEAFLTKTFSSHQLVVRHHNQKEKVDVTRWPAQRTPMIVLMQSLMTMGVTIPHKSCIWGVWEHFQNVSAAAQAVGRMFGHWSEGNDNRAIKLFVCKPLLESYLEFVQTGHPTTSLKLHTRVNEDGSWRKKSPKLKLYKTDIEHLVPRPSGIEHVPGRGLAVRHIPGFVDMVADAAWKKRLHSIGDRISFTLSTGNARTAEFFDTGKPLTGIRDDQGMLTVAIDNRPDKPWRVTLVKVLKDKTTKLPDLTMPEDTWSTDSLAGDGITVKPEVMEHLH